MDVDPLEAYASLSLQRGVGPVAVALARDAHGSLAGLVEALGAGRLDPRLARHAPALRRAFSRAELRAAGRALADWRGAGDLVLHLEDPGYPPSLAAIHDPPPLLFVRGALPAPLAGPAGAARVVAVVGTRRAGPWALDFARDLGRSLAAAGVTVVSGLALGVDGAAHRGALEGAPDGTVAVLGAGFDHLHPPTHRDLAARIARGGALLAEHPPDVRLAPGAFPRRNRLISGLARSVAVLEAPVRSGVRHTVEFALQQGRDVFVVPQRPDSEVGRGACALLRDGAAPLTSAADLLEDLPAPPRPATPGPEGDGSSLDPGSRPDGRLARAILAALDAIGAAPLERLLPPGVSPGAALAVLTELERAGRIAPDGTGRWRRSGG
jgi:DNA processing protein